MSDASQRLHTFFVVKQPNQSDRIVVWDTQDITLGRSADNDFVIDHAEISRRQAVFARLNSAYVIKNHSTSNPTYVNDQPIKAAELQTKDRVRVAETEMIFYRVAKNPATLGAKVEYASQLKDFASSGAQDSPDSTMLGLMDMAGEDEEEFEVRPARDFDYDLHGMDAGLEEGLGSAPKARNLDLEMDDPVLGDDAAGSSETWDLEDPPAQAQAQAQTQAAGRQASGGTFSLNLEIQGLSPEQQRFLQTVLGKVIQLPALRIRLKGDDLG